MRKLVSVIRLIVVFAVSVSMQSQVEVSKSNLWETSIFKKPVQSSQVPIPDYKKETSTNQQTIIAFVSVQSFIQYDAQILSEETSVVMTGPEVQEKSSIEEDYFRTTYRQDGFSAEYSEQETAALKGFLNLGEKDFFEDTIIAQSDNLPLAASSLDPYAGVGYAIHPNIIFALGWATQKVINRPKSLL